MATIRVFLDSFRTAAGHAIVWRDAINDWFRKASGIPDAQGRIGNDPNRIEAEDMAADGYKPIAITPAETASNGKAVICAQASGCTLTTTLHHPTGKYDIAVQYFDLRTGVSRYSLWINGAQIANWQASDALPPGTIHTRMDGHTSTRFTVRRVALRPGDHLELRGTPDLTAPPSDTEHRAISGTPSRPPRTAASLRRSTTSRSAPTAP
jgi:alpha-glucuronidase